MKRFLPKYKFISLFAFLTFIFVSAKLNAQLSFSVTPGLICYASGGTNTVTAQVTGTVSGAISYSWNIAGPPSCNPTFTNAVPNGSTINISYPCCGVYSLTLFAIGSGTTTLLGTTSATFFAICAPVVSISGNSVVCQGSPATLSAGGANTYSWVGGPSSSSISVTPTATTIYTVIGASGSCTNTALQAVSISTLPAVYIVPSNTAICASQTCILIANGALSYTWTSGPVSNSYAISPSTATSYTVTGSNGTCVNTAVQSILVYSLPVITVSPSSSVICSGHSATLVAGGANTYTWNGGINSPSIVVNPLATTVYTVVGANSAGCTGFAGQIVSVNPTPTINISPNSTICQGSSVTIVATGAQNYTWNIGATNSLIALSPTVTSIYVVHGSNSLGCIGIDSVTVNVIPPVFAGFVYTNLANGQVSFSNTSVNSTTNTSYIWNFGNGLTSSSISPSTTYTSNGIYTVTLTANSGCGPNTITQTLSITNIAGPACASNFTYVTGSPGNYNFVSTSTGTTSSTTYSWNFGNGTPIYTANASAGIQPPTQSYTNGTFTVALFIVNTNPACMDSFGLVINVCALNANFTHTQLTGNVVNFVSTSTNTLPTITYSWNYGDGGSGSGNNSSHTYSASGNYVVTLFATNNFSCTSIKNITITVSSCGLAANFSHTVGVNGAVQFSNTSSNSNTLTNYFWNFGDGVYSTAPNPTHTYNNAGTYYVKLKIKDTLNTYCRDSLTQAINVTGISCVANSNFTLTPTNTLHYWNATPAYPYNITAASWSWGDGLFSDSLYTTHMYASPGIYTICLSVTVSCGASSNYCFTYAVKSNETTSQIAFINVVAPALSTGILNIESENLSYLIYPNPNNGDFNINIERTGNKNLSLTVFNLVGETIYNSRLEPEDGNFVKTIHLENVVKGIYFVKLTSETKTYTQKIIIGD